MNIPQPEALGSMVGTVLGVSSCVGVLILAFKLRSLARSIRPAAILVCLLAVGGAAAYFGQGQLSAQQRDQITKFFESLADQARGVFNSQAQADDASPVSALNGDQPSPFAATGELPFELSNPLIDLTACVKQ